MDEAHCQQWHAKEVQPEGSIQEIGVICEEGGAVSAGAESAEEVITDQCQKPKATIES